MGRNRATGWARPGRALPIAIGWIVPVILLLLLGGSPGNALPSPRPAPQGFLGEYWAGATIPGTPGVPATPATVTQTDTRIDFSDSAPPAPAQPMTWPAGAGADNFIVRWTSFVQGPITGAVTFKTVSDDGIQLRVGGQTLITQWIDRGPNRTTPDTAVFNMTQGVWYPVEVIFYERGGGAEARLFWDYAGAPSVDGDITGAFVDQSPPPPTPTTLSIQTPQSFTPVINLSWTPVANATGYNIRRGGASMAETQYQTVAGNVTTFSDTNVFFNNTYFYQVQVVVNTLTSGNSNEVSGMPQAFPPRTTKVGNERDQCGCGSTGVPGLAALAGAALLLLLTLAFRQ